MQKKLSLVIIYGALFLCLPIISMAQEEKADNTKRKQIIPMDAVSILDITLAKVDGKTMKVQYESPVNQNLQAIVYNMDGQEIHKMEYIVNSGKSEQKHKLPGLEVGKYFISFFYGSQNKTYKFSVE